jgi:hypothetical protein
MCRNATLAGRNIRALTALPASGVPTNAAVPARENNRKKRKNQSLNLAVVKNLQVPDYIKHQPGRPKTDGKSTGDYGCAAPAFAPENGGQD